MSYLIEEAKNKYGSILFFKRKGASYSKELINNLKLEEPFVKALENEEYNTFIDIGAGFGYFTTIASHYTDKVLAFEPHPLRYGFLEWNTRNLKNVELYKKYIGTNQPHISKYPYGMVRSKSPKRTEIFNISTMRLDEIPFKSYNSAIIKIDVEGNEIDVILSAGNLLFEPYIIWLIEVHYKLIDRKQIFNLFKDFNAKQLEVRKMTEHWKFWREG